MLVSVVINTYNRVATLEQTLDALRGQTLRRFRSGRRQRPVDRRHRRAARRARARGARGGLSGAQLSQSRNLGIDAAAGEIVAFIDDDAIPEPGWLAELVAAYADPAVAGAGGVVLDHTGVHAQYRFSACDRVGRTDYDLRPPFDALSRAGRRPVPVPAGHEHELPPRRAGGGRRLRRGDRIQLRRGRPVPAADRRRAPARRARRRARAPQGRAQPPAARRPGRHWTRTRSRTARTSRSATDVATRDCAEIVASLERLRSSTCARPRASTPRHGPHHPRRARPLARPARSRARGSAWPRAGRPRAGPRTLAPRDVEPSCRIPVPQPEGRRLRIVLRRASTTRRRAAAGSRRFTQDLAARLAAEGHEVHVVTPRRGPGPGGPRGRRLGPPAPVRRALRRPSSTGRRSARRPSG